MWLKKPVLCKQDLKLLNDSLKHATTAEQGVNHGAAVDLVISQLSLLRGEEAVTPSFTFYKNDQNGLDWCTYDFSVKHFKVLQGFLDKSNLLIFNTGGRHILIDKKGRRLVGYLFTTYSGNEGNVNVTVYKSYSDIVERSLRPHFLGTPPDEIYSLYVERRRKEIAVKTMVPRRLPPHPDIMVNYPYLDESPAQLWDRFAAAKENVLLFIGPPGTGKSSFSSLMMEHRGYSKLKAGVYYISKEELLTRPDLVDFLETLPPGSVVIVEDSDTLTEKRTNRNELMSAFLNICDGIIDYGIKFIISTNLESLNSVDGALIRPGRTLDVVKFRMLTLQEANTARNAMGLEAVNDSASELTLSEALNYREGITQLRQKTGY